MFLCVFTVTLIIFVLSQNGFGQKTTNDQIQESYKDLGNMWNENLQGILLDMKEELKTELRELKAGQEALQTAQNELKAAQETEKQKVDCDIYLFPNIEKNWFDARAYCKERGENLVSIETAEEHSCLKELIRANNFRGEYVSSHDTHAAVWTSGNDLKEESNFVWNSTGAEITYKSWSPKQPDNWRGREHCVTLSNYLVWNLNMNDEDCQALRQFICE